MKKLLLIMVLFLCTSMSIAGKSLKPLKVMLDGFPSALYAPLFIAEQQGYFHEQGLSVLLMSAKDARGAAESVANHKADLGLMPEPLFMQTIASGSPLAQIGKLIDKPLDSIVVLQESGIHGLNGLRGKRINVADHGLSDSTLKTLLANAGIDEKEVTFVKTNTPLTEALLTHEVDAVIGLSRNTDIPMLESRGHALVAFFPEEHGVPSYNALIFMSLAANKEDARFAPFLIAVKKAVQYLEAHPKLAWQKMIKTYPSFNTPQNHETWFATLPYFAENPAGFDTQTGKRFEQFMQTHALLEVKPTPADKNTSVKI